MTSRTTARKHAAGMTLIEVIIALVVIATCIVGVLGLLTSLATRSAEAPVHAQATSIAIAYLEEILAEPYVDSGPDGETARALFDDVDDYDNLDDSGARNQFGTPLAGLTQYRVQVRIVPVQLGLAPNSIAARRVDVTVTPPASAAVMLSGYRTQYVGQVLY